MTKNHSNSASETTNIEIQLQLALETLYRITAELALIDVLNEADRERLNYVVRIAAARALKIDEHLTEKKQGF
ncbi:hypothetical protein [Erwinia sp. LJJL01]|uniref:hypothetical protein n=1 Tax=Erwinia sp. LJJL01 TaxID=3391839 RepID=UPI00105C2F0B